MPFSPWNESERAPLLDVVMTASIQDTGLVDPYRQGVELRTTKDLFLGSQPKFWGGTSTRYGVLDHQAVDGPESYGTPGSWTHYSGSVKWSDQDRWEPVAYIRNTRSFVPPVETEGLSPSVLLESVMEPLEISGRTGKQEEASLEVHRTLGDFQCVGLVVEPGGALKPWQEHSSNLTGSLRGNAGYWVAGSSTIAPWKDHDQTKVVDSLTGVSGRFRDVILSLEADLDLDLEVRSNQGRSAAAGRDVYGPGQGRTGTDSLAFAGTTRGS